MKQSFTELIIQSNTENLCRVEQFVDDVCETYYITNSYYGNILVAVLEAVRNAVVHGNGNNQEKTVALSFKRLPNGLCFTVTDEGNGFDFMSVPNPLDIADGNNENTGNGIFLMRSLADQISYNKKGNKVEIVFYISSINQETTLNRITQIHKYFNKQKSMA